MDSQKCPPSRSFDRFEGNTILVDLATDVKGSCSDISFNGEEWLREQLSNQCAIGFDMEWKPDRYSGSDNHVALIQLANAETALLLRTHRRRHWLPGIVRDVLTDPSVPKICVGYDGSDRRKLESSFGFLLEGVIDLSDLAVRKGLRHTGLKKLAEDFGWHMKKESYVARGDWQAPRLSQAQIQYAAEDAYFTYMLYGKMKDLPDSISIDTEKSPKENPVCLSMLPGWSEQAIEHRDDGMWCALCNKGPMKNSDVIIKHITGKIHRRKADAVGLEEYTSDVQQDSLVMDGIVCENSSNKSYEDTCTATTLQTTLVAKKSLPHNEPNPIEEQISSRAGLHDDVSIEVGSFVRALTDVVSPPPSWSWHPSTYLLIGTDDDIEVLAQEGEWLYGSCCGREGWVQRATVRLVDRASIANTPQEETKAYFCSEAGIAVVQIDVPMPPPTWVWRAADFLTLAAGESVQILCEDGGWLYGRSGSRVGWFHETALQNKQAQCQNMSLLGSGTCQVAQNPKSENYRSMDQVTEAGQLKCVRHAVTGPPDGMSPCNFLLVTVGEHVLVEHIEDDWLWGETSGRRGWLPLWAFGEHREVTSSVDDGQYTIATRITDDGSPDLCYCEHNTTLSHAQSWGLVH